MITYALLHIRCLGTPGSLIAQLVKNLPAMQETGLDSWVRKIPRRRKWQPTPVFLPGESHRQRSLATVLGVTRAGHDLVTRERKERKREIWVITYAPLPIRCLGTQVGKSYSEDQC